MTSETRRMLIIGKTYPTPSRKSIEAVCTAAIDEDGRLLRLYPIPFRHLKEERQFKLFSLISARIEKNRKDPRKESYRIDADSIKILEQIEPQNKQERWKWIGKGVVKGHEPDRIHESGASLAIIRAKWRDLIWEEQAEKTWSAGELASLRQQDLFVPQHHDLLEKVPWHIKLRYHCADGPSCRGHEQTIFSWHVNWRFLKAKRTSSDHELAKADVEEALRRGYLREDRELYLLIGTMRDHPASWIIIDLMTFPKNIVAQGTLF